MPYEPLSLVTEILFAVLKIALVLGAFLKLTEKPQEGRQRAIVWPLIFLLVGIGVESLDLYGKHESEAKQSKRFVRLLAPLGDVFVQPEYILRPNFRQNDPQV